MDGAKSQTGLCNSVEQSCTGRLLFFLGMSHKWSTVIDVLSAFTVGMGLAGSAIGITWAACYGMRLFGIIVDSDSSD